MGLTGLDWGEAALIFLLSFAAVTSALLVSGLISSRTARGPQPEQEDAVFLFDDGLLVDASAAGRGLLAQIPDRGTGWNSLTEWLTARSPAAGARLSSLLVGEKMRCDIGAPLILDADREGELLRIAIADGSSQQAIPSDRISLIAQQDELSALRLTTQHCPTLIWRQAGDGTVTWANSGYFDLVRQRAPQDEDVVWPLPRLFDGLNIADGAERDPAKARRFKLAENGDQPLRWFEILSFEETDGALHFATPADALIKAETSLREFVQTLSKTFAHLSVGLAIFDRSRKLQIFNPALTDLTHIGFEMLSARPSLFAFLEQLRENRMMPERKDYATWRQHMTELEKAAASGGYEETWNLPTGQTYRVTGRPHPDGAVALMIEDISAEISLTRRFRADLELGQEVLDNLPHALAVFGQGGNMVISNAAYSNLWGIDPGTMLCQPALTETLRHWQSLTHPSPLWAEVAAQLATVGNRETWQGQMSLRDGRAMDCRVAPMTQGAMLVSFSVVTESTPTLVLERLAT